MKSPNTPEQFIEARLARLEKSAQRWRLLACSLLILGIAGVSMGQIVLGGGTGGMHAPLVTTDKLVANKSVVLNDGNGNTRLVLSTGDDSAKIEMKNKDDKTLLVISSDDKAATILIQSPEGKKLWSAP